MVGFVSAQPTLRFHRPCQARRRHLAIRAADNRRPHVTRGSAMPTHKLLLLPGDGIGPEAMAEVKKLIAWMNAPGLGQFRTTQALLAAPPSLPHNIPST